MRAKIKAMYKLELPMMFVVLCI